MFDQLARVANLRDLGGHPAFDGMQVRKGCIYRSAALSGLSGAMLETVRALGIHTIVDLRHNRERAAHPTPWEAMGCTRYWFRDHNQSTSAVGDRVSDPALTEEMSRTGMNSLYRRLPYEQAEAYTRLFQALACGDMPVLFHCAVGKDRTGVAAALILAVLGVERDRIAADYAATAHFDITNSPHLGSWPDISEERRRAMAPLLAARPEYIESMFAELAERSGTPERYLRDTLGLDEGAIAAIREHLLEPRRRVF
ncbi:tyrosine-protein phosphatase [Novosphingobium pentaromativorans]|uniref:Protein tyrosine/serine phosphatase n=2 Tax=Novosphingobium pentaromativorans TaxID=205844 RepID=G6EDA8_9SPHN|nr:tyrosine-protein phosphatase [Novosphingobium pentaromativorans]AIT79805.1 hypothetical protein JI59_08445 [Novosphingobium pentaromativorans US6-1]EHJ60707.1 hypothetical protein NSU_2329 [Novosphingobium pentaromativorans US6-1]